MSKKCNGARGCVPGCSDQTGNTNWCQDVGLNSQSVYQCAFQPSDLGAMLGHHEIRASQGAYNEVIVDPTSWNSENAADHVESFFFVKPPMGRGDEDAARDVHRRFYERYGSTVMVPLVRLDLFAPPGTPVFVRVA